MIKEKTVCFTGHRPQKLPWGFNEEDYRCLIMKEELKQLIEESINNGYLYFISGLALGFDIIAAEMVLEIKKECPRIKLIAALPCKDQCRLWSKEQIKRYKHILSKCDNVKYLYNTYNYKCMLERNDYMLNNSSMVIALYNGKGGGTGYTLKKAKDKQLQVKILGIYRSD